MSPEKFNNNEVHPMDAYIGQHVRQCRTSLEIRQRQLAEILRCSLQQLKDYENGQESISAKTLYEISLSLPLSLTDMFEQTPTDIKEAILKKAHIQRKVSLQDITPIADHLDLKRRSYKIAQAWLSLSPDAQFLTEDLIFHFLPNAKT